MDPFYGRAEGQFLYFISGHNGHIERFGNYGAGTRVMGNILSDELGDGYFAIGTDFYKTNCNLPKMMESVSRTRFIPMIL